MSVDRPHHLNGPSSLFRRQQCPGSAKMEDGLPESLDKEMAEYGTKMHEAAMTNHELRKDKDVDPGMMEFWDSRVYGTYGEDGWHYEDRVDIYGSNGELLSFGYADAWKEWDTNPEAAALADAKFGYIPADEASVNIQLGAYALGLHQKYKFRGVVATLVQPPLFRSSTYVFSNFDAIQYNIETIIDATLAPTLSLAAGSHCTYCRAKSICPAFRNHTQEVIAAPSLPAITAENVAELYGKASLVDKLARELKARIKAEVELNGGSLGSPGNGLRLKPRRGNASHPDIQKTYNAVSDVFDKDEFMAFCSVQHGPLKDAYSRRLRAIEAVPSIRAGVQKFEETVPTERGEDTVSIAPWNEGDEI